jgi:DNA repair protein RecO (recombination protein O)
MGLRSTRAIVSNTMRMSNSSKLVSLITENYGLVKVMAKGARRPQSRYGASLEPVTLIDSIFYHKENREIQTLGSVELIEDYPRIKSEMRMLSTASCMVEASQTVTMPEDPSAGTFPLLTESLASLEKSSEKESDKHLWRFMLRLINAAGYQPVFDRCAVCGKKPRSERVFFSFQDGGLICSCTGCDEKYGFWISPGALMVMKSLTARQEDFSHISIGTRQRAEIQNAVFKLFSYNTGTSRIPRSLAFLKKLEAFEKSEREEHSTPEKKIVSEAMHEVLNQSLSDCKVNVEDEDEE